MLPWELIFPPASEERSAFVRSLRLRFAQRRDDMRLSAFRKKNVELEMIAVADRSVRATLRRMVKVTD
jgi:hypothetical protein